VLEETVRRNLNTHRASRHFRNFWWYYPDGFESCRNDLQQTWPGTDIEPPHREKPLDTKLTMFSKEGAYIRELYWAGLGFQVWCQLLTHIGRAEGSSLLLVDEPETYLHPNLQRQVLHLLRATRGDVFLATHSSEIVAEAESSEILIVDRTRKSARRAGDVAGVQAALQHIGSGRNLVLTQLARTSHALLVEGDDFTYVRAIARALNLPSIGGGLSMAPFPLEGFPTVERVRSIRDAIRETLGPDVYLAGMFDRDHRCDEEVDELRIAFRRHLDLALVLDRHEIENYFLSPSTVQLAVDRAWNDRGLASVPANAEPLLRDATDELKAECIASRGAERYRFLRSNGVSVVAANRAAAVEVEARWSTLSGRISLVPGKELLSALNRRLQPQGVQLSIQSLGLALAIQHIDESDVAMFMRTVERRFAPTGSRGKGAVRVQT
jgi:hypothetical protein